MVGGEASYGPIRSQSFSEAMPLDCELWECFSDLFHPPLGGTEWLEWDGVGLPSPKSIRF